MAEGKIQEARTFLGKKGIGYAKADATTDEKEYFEGVIYNDGVLSNDNTLSITLANYFATPSCLF